MPPRRARSMVAGTPGPATLVACFVVQTGLIGLGYFLQPSAPVAPGTSTPAPALTGAVPAPCPPVFEQGTRSFGPWTWGLFAALVFFAGLGVSCTYYAVRGLLTGTAAGVTAGLAGAAAGGLFASRTTGSTESERELTPYDGAGGRRASAVAIEDW